MKKRQFLLSQGYKVKTIQQCQFINQIKDKCTKLYDKYLPSYFQRNKTSLTESKILKDIKKGSLFGAVEVDIWVKEEFKDYFSEYPPFFAPVMFLCMLLVII